MHFRISKDSEGSTKRIHNKGKDSNNQIIGTNSKRGGKYSLVTKSLKIQNSWLQIWPYKFLQLQGDLLRFYCRNFKWSVCERFQDDQNTLKSSVQ